MIKFFRKIRYQHMETGKTTRYFKYALGEIILVVIGILIALQINNWNESRKNQIEASTILNSLNLELIDDFDAINGTVKSLEKRKSNSNYLYDLILGHTVQIDSSKVVEALMNTGFIYKFVPSFAVYNEIQNSGKLGLINSDNLKKYLANYKSQVEENYRIEGSYDISVKKFEQEATKYLIEIPISTEKRLYKKYKLIKFNTQKLSKDEAFLNLLKHISYITEIELALKRDLLIPKMELLKKLITKALER
jgi:hypothetical protein